MWLGGAARLADEKTAHLAATYPVTALRSAGAAKGKGKG